MMAPQELRQILVRRAQLAPKAVEVRLAQWGNLEMWVRRDIRVSQVMLQILVRLDPLAHKVSMALR